MRQPLLLGIAFAIVSSWHVATQSDDRAVISAFRRADASLTFSRVWHRVDVGDGMDLVVTLGSSQSWSPSPSGRIWGGTTQRIGIFFQERRSPGIVYLITVAPAFAGCDAASLARATRTDLVVWCEGEKSELQPAQKFVYDIRAKALVARFDFQPFTNYTAKRGANGQIFVHAESSNRRIALTLTPPFGFAVASDQRKAQPSLEVRSRDVAGRRFGPGGSFRLVEIPDSATDVCGNEIVVAAGSRRYRQPWKECGAIGPNQEVGDRLWFGRAFYHGEGWFGTGGFGYFDTNNLHFQMFRSPKVTPSSTTAIHVVGESVWLALADHGEYGSATRGVLFFPSPQSEPRHLNTGYCVGRDFVDSGESLYLLTDCGIVLIRPDGVSGYIADLASDGRVRVVPGLP